VVFDFWYTSSDDIALSFVKDFKERAEKMGTSLYFKPRFVTLSCENCSDERKETDCISQGKYCGVESFGKQIFSFI
jgi:hypothetical protein